MISTFNYRALPLVHRPCALCGADEFETLARCDRYGFGLTTVGCRQCGLVQTNPVPAPEALRDFYERFYRQVYQAVLRPDEQYIRDFGKRERLLYTAEYLRRTLALCDESVLLDFGCGEGSLFGALREMGYRGHLEGVEANPEFRKFAARVGRADVHDSLEAALRSGAKFDVIVVNHVLEHFTEPTALLRGLADLLRPDGVLYIDVPDAERYASVNDLHIAHVLHFTRDTLHATLVMAGLGVRAIERHAPPGHPPSLRVIAMRKGDLRADARSRSDMESAMNAWRAIHGIQRRYWAWYLRRRLASFPGARSLWHSLRRRKSIERRST